MTEQQQEELKQLILSDKPAYFAKLREEVGDNPKALKAIAIVENIMKLADLTVEGVKLRSNKKKRIFSKHDRKTKRYLKREKAKNIVINAMQQRMQLAQLQMIQAQPLPKFPKGWNDEHRAVEINGGAYIVEQGKEMIINRSRSQYGNYPYPVDPSKCEHVFGTKTVNVNWQGDMKAVCIKCGYEP